MTIAASANSLQITSLAGLDQLVERADLLLAAGVVAPILVLIERQGLDPLLDPHALADGGLHGPVLIGPHSGGLGNVGGAPHLAPRPPEAVRGHLRARLF